MVRPRVPPTESLTVTVSVDALLAVATPEFLAQFGSAQKPSVELTPLAELPPADAGIVAALGPASAHHGRKWFVCGAVGGIMRKLGFPAARCEANPGGSDNAAGGSLIV